MMDDRDRALLGEALCHAIRDGMRNETAEQRRERIALAVLPTIIERGPANSMFRQHAKLALQCADVFIDECSQPKETR